MPTPVQTSSLTPRAAQRAIEKLAEGHTDAAEEKAIVDILESLSDTDRGEALRLIDGGGDHHTVDHLLNDDIDDTTQRDRATRLIDAARPYMSSPGRFVISDIDDTVHPDRDPDVHGDRYPGAAALFRALDVGKDGTDVDGDVHFVTARDGVFVHASDTLRKTGIDYNSVRYGNTAAGLASLLGILQGIEDEKVRDVREMLKRNPSRSAVLVGDTVQADPAVYRRILNESPSRVEVVLLHEVKGHPAPLDMKNNPNVVVFTDYADAAQQLHARGLISDEQLDDVIHDR
jgi:phosphatidate phosphatase APP1